jgi:Fe-S-cluster-containing dehydrogenase component
MRKEDRRAYLLHPETADLLLRHMDQGPLVPALNDGDICLHCRRHQCIASCPTGALETRTDGRLEITEDRCVSCGACVVACFEFTNITWRPRRANGS